MTERKRARTPEAKKDEATGTWSWRFDSQHPNANGRRRQIHRRGFRTEREAKAALKTELAKDGELAERDDGLTVATVLDRMVSAKRLAGKATGTVNVHSWAADHIRKRFGTWQAARLTSDHLDAFYLDQLAANMSARSVAILHATVKAAFQLAVDRGQLVRNPARLATAPASTATARPYWSPEQVGTFLAFVEGRDVATRGQYRLPGGLIELLADTGARRGELLALAWSSVDLEAGTVSITRGLTADASHKTMLSIGPTKRPRAKSVVTIHPATVAALRARKRAQIEDRLAMGAGWPREGIALDLAFTWADGTVVHPDVFTKSIARSAVEAGLPRLTPHGLRHSFATAALSARVPVEIVAARLGNTARVVQETYAHVLAADDAAAAHLVGDLYRQTPRS